MRQWFIFIYFAIFVVTLTSCEESTKVLRPEVIEIAKLDDIVSLDDSLVSPFLYRDIPHLSQLPVKESKEKFIAIVLPAILVAKYHLDSIHIKVNDLLENQKWSQEDSAFYRQLVNRFKAKDINDLLVRSKTHPNSIVLAQAAVESGWGSSRFFKEGNNLFGIWSYNKKEPRIAAKESDVFLRKYDDISQSVTDYFITIGRARAYSKFRETRAESNDVYELLPYLNKYSERGVAYTRQLKKLIDQNNFEKYDRYKIDPSFFAYQ